MRQPARCLRTAAQAVIRNLLCTRSGILAVALLLVFCSCELRAAPQEQEAEKSQRNLEPTADLVFGTANLRGHVSCAKFSPDGKFVVTAGDNVIQFWDPVSGELRRQWESRVDRFTDIEFSPNGSLLAIGGGGGNLSVWDLKTGEEILARSGVDLFTQGIRTMAFSPDAKRLICVTAEEESHIWDTQTWEHIKTLRQGSSRDAKTVAWSTDGKLLAIGINGSVHIHDGDDYEYLRQIETGAPVLGGLSFVSDNELLIAITEYQQNGADQTKFAAVDIWDAETGERVRRAVEGAPGTGIRWSCLSPDRSQLIVRGMQSLKVYDLANGELDGVSVSMLNVVINPEAMTVSPDGKMLALSEHRFSLQLYDLQEKARVQLADAGHDQSIQQLCVSRDGSRLATLGGDGSVHLWDTQTGQTQLSVFCGSGKYPLRCCWSPDGRSLYVGGMHLEGLPTRGFLQRYDALSGETLLDTSLPDVVEGIAISADGKRLAVSKGKPRTAVPPNEEDFFVSILNPQTGQRITRVPPERLLDSDADNTVYHHLKFSADAKELLTAPLYSGPSVDRWNLESQELLSEHAFEFRGPSALAAETPALAAISKSDNIEVVDTSTMQTLQSIALLERHFYAVAISVDGKWLASMSYSDASLIGRQGPGSCVLDIWNVGSGELVHSISQLQHLYLQLRFSPDGKWLYASPDAGFAVGWDLSEKLGEQQSP